MTANKRLTLAFVRDVGRVLLGYKKRGFGCGRWNGFGGKVHPDETEHEGAVRELEEESSLIAPNLDKIGLLMFEFLGDPQLMEVHVYTTEQYTGTPTESDEMRPMWYRHEDIPFSSMWPDDILWFPFMFRNKPFYGYFKFKGMNDIIDYKLTEVDDIHKVRIPPGPQPTCG